MKKLFCILSVVLLVSSTLARNDRCDNQLFSDLLKEVHGTSVKYLTYVATTPDGYQLNMFRLSFDGNWAGANAKEQILLQHGLTSSADCWVWNDGDWNLAIRLLQKGYDVWLGNNRGNKYSEKNNQWDISQKEFWEFSFQQLGRYDVSTQISKVLTTVGKSQLYYMGHSQGTSQMFAALSERDVATRNFVRQSVKKFIALAPVAMMANVSNQVFQNFSTYNEGIYNIGMGKGKWQVQENKCQLSPWQEPLYEAICKTNTLFCELNFFTMDVDPKQNNLAKSGRMKARQPQGSSLQSYDHYAQNIDQKNPPRFMYFNWGPARNLQEYGTEFAPEYDLTSIPSSIPITAWVATGDKLSTVPDAYKTQEHIPHMKLNIIQDWGHATFVFGLNPGAQFDQIIDEIPN